MKVDFPWQQKSFFLNHIFHLSWTLFFNLWQVQDAETNKYELMKIVKGSNGSRKCYSSENQSSDWKLEFERQRKQIIQLWDTCYIPLVHRSIFFLLFQGDPSDSVYMEVEYRRLSFLMQTTSRGTRYFFSWTFYRLSLAFTSACQNIYFEFAKFN